MTALEARTGSDPSPLAQVLQLCARGATGEVVGVAGNLEVLISLQGGRLAWATSNTERRLFTRVLLETTRLRTALRVETETVLEVLRGAPRLTPSSAPRSPLKSRAHDHAID